VEALKTQGRIELGVAARSLEEGLESGDRPVVIHHENGSIVGAVDGLGHGTAAAAAAVAAIETLMSHAGLSLPHLFGFCHERLKETRGAAMSLAEIDRPGRMMTWLAVGNVMGVLFRCQDTDAAPRHLVMRGGTVGARLPNLAVSTFPVERGDTLILATDGVRGGFADMVDLAHGPSALSREILDRQATGEDDALVVVARFTGESL